MIHSSNSLWSKMVQLTSNRNSRLLGQRRMLPRKILAHKDKDVARLIMNDINRARMYQMQHHRNPMKFIQILKHSKPKFENPFSRQYVFNGATFVPVPTDGSPPTSYLNSAPGGGLAPGARYRWTGATFIPVNPDDLPMVSDETEIKPQDKSESPLQPPPQSSQPADVESEDRPDPGFNPYQYYPGIAPDPNSKYVFNGATFVPIQAGMGRESSYLNTDDGGGLTPAGKYRWNGATFVDNSLDDSPNAFSVNNEIQRILDLWNNNNNKNLVSKYAKDSKESNPLDDNAPIQTPLLPPP